MSGVWDKKSELRDSFRARRSTRTAASVVPGSDGDRHPGYDQGSKDRAKQEPPHAGCCLLIELRIVADNVSKASAFDKYADAPDSAISSAVF